MTTQTKILIVGDGGVGKTSAIERHFDGVFSTSYTAGNEIQEHIFQKNSHRRIIYDFPGQCRYNFGALTADIGAIDSAIVMYDLTSNISHRNVTQWTKFIKEKFVDVPVKLVGTKADLVDRITLKTNDDKISAKKNSNLQCIF